MKRGKVNPWQVATIFLIALDLFLLFFVFPAMYYDFGDGLEIRTRDLNSIMEISDDEIIPLCFIEQKKCILVRGVAS